jgi:hypothetical protein
MLSARTKHSLWWLFVAGVVVVVQAFNCFVAGNTLNHLTNWAWLLSGATAAGFAVCGRLPYLWLYALTLGTASFVAGAITALMVMDNLMVARYVDEMGAGVVWTANVLLHYAPLLWLLVLPEARGRMAELHRQTMARDKTIQLWAQVNLLPMLFVLTYGTWFDVRTEYPGAHIDFVVLYAVGFATQAATACALF